MSASKKPSVPPDAAPAAPDADDDGATVKLPASPATDEDETVARSPSEEDFATVRLSASAVAQIELVASAQIDALVVEGEQLDLPTIRLAPVTVVTLEHEANESTVELTKDALPAELLQAALPFRERALDPPPVVSMPLRVPVFSMETPPSPTPPARPPAVDKPIDVARFAAIAAELASGTPASVLARQGLTPEAWANIERDWTARLATEAARGETTLRDAYDEAFLEARALQRGAFDLKAFAELRVELEAGVADEVLAGMALDVADAMRFQRLWARKVAADPTLGRQLGEALALARSRRA